MMFLAWTVVTGAVTFARLTMLFPVSSMIKIKNYSLLDFDGNLDLISNLDIDLIIFLVIVTDLFLSFVPVIDLLLNFSLEEVIFLVLIFFENSLFYFGLL